MEDEYSGRDARNRNYPCRNCDERKVFDDPGSPFCGARCEKQYERKRAQRIKAVGRYKFERK
jgi:hypothetical protein